MPQTTRELCSRHGVVGLTSRVAAVVAVMAATLALGTSADAASSRTAAAKPHIKLASNKVEPKDPICAAYGLQSPSDYQWDVTATGFQPAEKVTFRMSQLGSRVVASATANSKGDFSVKFTDPDQQAAKETLSATGTKGSKASAAVTSYFATCYVEEDPAPWDGVGWKAGSTVTFKVGKKVAGKVTANEEGSFSTKAKWTCGSQAEAITIVGIALKKEVVPGGSTC
jgi:hypothetical protein